MTEPVLNLDLSDLRDLDSLHTGRKWDKSHRKPQNSKKRGPLSKGEAGKVRKQRPAVPKNRHRLETPVSKDTLKGYELSSQVGQDREQQSPGKAEKTKFRKSNNITRFNPDRFSHPSSADPPLRGQDVIAGQAGPLLSSRPAEPPSGDMAEPETARPDDAGNDPDSDADIAEAMVLSMQKDQRIEADHDKHKAITQQSLPEGVQVEDSEDEEELQKTVSFIDETRRLSVPVAKKRKRDLPEESPVKRRKGLGNVHPQRGELTHAGTAVPDHLRALVMGEAEVSSFADLGVAQSLSNYLAEMNFQAPTQVQQKAIPILLAGRDAVVKAPTGSGKTLAYLIPIINYLQAQSPRVNRGDGTFALVLAPTRELAIQIQDVLCNILRRYFYLVGGSVAGGENKNKEKARLRKGVHVLVATPGRLLDHLQNTAAFQTSELKWLVLDEADRLLDLGFEQKIREIVRILDERLKETQDGSRQTVLLSATMPEKLNALIAVSLQDPVFVGYEKATDCEANDGEARPTSETLGADEEEAGQFSIPEQLDQRYLQAPDRQRLAALAAVLRRSVQAPGFQKMLVFMSTCDSVEFHHHLFQDAFKHIAQSALLSCPIWKLYGDLPQKERTQTFLDFSRCKQGVLFCTDVAARGLDFPSITAVVQFDPPGEVAEYVHRVGRSARMGQAGQSYLFLLPSEMDYLSLLRERGCFVREFRLHDAYKYLPSLPTKGRNNVDLDKSQYEPLESVTFTARLTQLVGKDAHLTTLASNAFRAFVRAYATFPSSLKSIFHVKKLHLGHVAGSFALKTSPTLLGKSVRKEQKRLKHSKDKNIRKSSRKSRS